MAAYNGARYIQEQLDSILSELEPADEVIVVDDKSTDETAAIVRACGDSRITLVEASVNAGYVKTFERAVGLATREVIFLSDQDDTWMPGRVDAMLDELGDSLMVVSNCEHVGAGAGRFHDIRLRQRDSRANGRNIVGILVGYRLHWGCAMAFRRELVDVALPFPSFMAESHDQYLAMAANVMRSVTYMEQDTIWHRLHGTNLTPSGLRTLRKIVGARWNFLRELSILVVRARRAAKRKAQ